MWPLEFLNEGILLKLTLKKHVLNFDNVNFCGFFFTFNADGILRLENHDSPLSFKPQTHIINYVYVITSRWYAIYISISLA